MKVIDDVIAYVKQFQSEGFSRNYKKVVDAPLVQVYISGVKQVTIEAQPLIIEAIRSSVENN